MEPDSCHTLVWESALPPQQHVEYNGTHTQGCPTLFWTLSGFMSTLLCSKATTCPHLQHLDDHSSFICHHLAILASHYPSCYCTVRLSPDTAGPCSTPRVQDPCVGTTRANPQHQHCIEEGQHTQMTQAESITVEAPNLPQITLGPLRCTHLGRALPRAPRAVPPLGSLQGLPPAALPLGTWSFLLTVCANTGPPLEKSHRGNVSLSLCLRA